mgnify:CR=1 FL=1
MSIHQRIWTWIKERKAGILFGSAVGAAIYFGLISPSPQAQSLFSAASPSALDKVVTIGTQWKYLIGLILIGAGVGAAVDDMAKRR